MVPGLALLVLACGPAPAPGDPAADTVVETVTVPVTDSADVPSGELRLVQLRLTDGLSTGESMLIVGPEGAAVLVDVGNDAHADQIAAALDRELGVRRVDATLLTHFHADHIGGLDALFDLGLDPGVIVTRGPVDLGRGANQDELDEVVGDPAWASRVDLCTASACPGLPWTLPLGPGAELVVFAANGRTSDGAAFEGEIPDDDDGENARSLAGVISFGAFRFVFAGDLTGGGKGTPDLESFVASHLPDGLVPETGAALLHLDHHGIDSSTNEAWLDRFLPADGVPGDGITGANGTYLDAPGDDVMGRIAGHLDGGHVWVPEAGSLADESDPNLRVTGADVVVRATAAGEVVIE